MGLVQYFALKTGHEIDFILDTHLAIDAKETPIEGDLTHLSGMAKNAGIADCKLVGRYKSPRCTEYAWAGSLL
jgi:hypothetical protein